MPNQENQHENKEQNAGVWSQTRSLLEITSGKCYALAQHSFSYNVIVTIIAWGELCSVNKAGMCEHGSRDMHMKV